jgi:hypothetical protein
MRIHPQCCPTRQSCLSRSLLPQFAAVSSPVITLITLRTHNIEHVAVSGDESARGQLFAELYPELRRLAHARMQGNRSTLLGTTALVHESYVRFLKSGRIHMNLVL